MFVLEQCSVEHIELGGLGGARGTRGICRRFVFSYLFTLWDYYDHYSGAKLI